MKNVINNFLCIVLLFFIFSCGSSAPVFHDFQFNDKLIKVHEPYYIGYVVENEEIHFVQKELNSINEAEKEYKTSKARLDELYNYQLNTIKQYNAQYSTLIAIRYLNKINMSSTVLNYAYPVFFFKDSSNTNVFCYIILPKINFSNKHILQLFIITANGQIIEFNKIDEQKYYLSLNSDLNYSLRTGNYKLNVLIGNENLDLQNDNYSNITLTL